MSFQKSKNWTISADAVTAAKANIYSSNSEDEVSDEDERSRKRLLKAKKLDSDQVSPAIYTAFFEGVALKFKRKIVHVWEIPSLTDLRTGHTLMKNDHLTHLSEMPDDDDLPKWIVSPAPILHVNSCPGVKGVHQFLVCRDAKEYCKPLNFRVPFYIAVFSGDIFAALKFCILRT